MQTHRVVPAFEVLNFGSFYTIAIGTTPIPISIGLAALVVNLVLVVILTPLLRLIGISEGQDMTTATDFETRPVTPRPSEPQERSAAMFRDSPFDRV